MVVSYILITRSTLEQIGDFGDEAKRTTARYSDSVSARHGGKTAREKGTGTKTSMAARSRTKALALSKERRTSKRFRSSEFP
jgi:hypothetical protein